MSLYVSTKVEQAWYVDPELLAGDGEDERPRRVEIDADAPPAKDSTVVLEDADLVELSAALAGGGGDDLARHYQQVSLRGAIMAADETVSTLSLAERLRGLVDDGISLLEKGAAMAPGLPTELPNRVRSRLAATARGAFELLEPGRVAPARLAAVCFLAGVGMTLVGVLLAL